MKIKNLSESALFARRDALVRALADAEREIDAIDREIEARVRQARDYADAARHAARDWQAPASYADIRGH
jgi:hypothetical protein